MAKKQIRDRNYFEERLRHEHPSIFADLLAGKYPSVRAAAVAAGIVKPQRSINRLKNGWQSASKQERGEFLAWIASTSTTGGSWAEQMLAAGSDGRLHPWAITRIGEIMAKRSITYGDMMREMGEKPLDGSIANARKASGGARIRNSLVLKLEDSLHENRRV